MKPLVSTSGIKNGSLNESPILSDIQSSIESNTVLESNAFMLTERIEPKSLTVQHVRTIGIIFSKAVLMLSDSPYGIIVISDDNENMIVSSIEAKTMTSLSTIKAARTTMRDFHSLVYI